MTDQKNHSIRARLVDAKLLGFVARTYDQDDLSRASSAKNGREDKIEPIEIVRACAAKNGAEDKIEPTAIVRTSTAKNGIEDKIDPAS